MTRFADKFIPPRPKKELPNNLVATAPRLLEVLREVADLLEFHAGSASPEFHGAFPTIRVNGDDWDRALLKIRAAIAEAEGEA